jgi:hypothetical protein
MPITERERERDREHHEHMTEVKNVATYQAPGILATLKGRPVRLIATGDAPGHSPVCQYVDEDGRVYWEEQDRFIVIDSSFLPPSRETLSEVLRSMNR